jgi:hypothetical protein
MLEQRNPEEGYEEAHAPDELVCHHRSTLLW